MNSFLVAAGACISESQYWCALEASQCPIGANFVSARKLEMDFKDAPAVECLAQAGTVPMGQCTMPDDKGLCTGNKSNCGGCFETFEKCFEPNNGACTLEATENDDGSLNFAVFGVCVDPKNPNEGHCLWTRDECPSTSVWITPNVWLENKPNIEDFCSCDKVLVGACRYGDDFVCAVSEDACEDETQYIGAKALVDMEPSIDCRLCESLDLPEKSYPVPQQQLGNPVSNSEDYVQRLERAAAGACVTDDKYWCALEKTRCPTGSKFVSARIILTDFSDSLLINCLDKAIVVPMGQCTLPSDNGLCTGHESNCQGCYETAGVCFEPETDACTLEATADQDGDLNFASFGLCVDPKDPTEGHCMWSRNECPYTDTWLTPSRRLGNSPEIEDVCTCDKVLIGACRFGDEFACAVSEDACDDNSEYLGAKRLRDLDTTIDCRLCESFTVPENFPQQQNTPVPLATTLTPTHIITHLPAPTSISQSEVIDTTKKNFPKDEASNSTSNSLLNEAQTPASGSNKASILNIAIICAVCITALTVAIWGVEKRRYRGISEFSGDEYSDDQIIKASWEMS